MSDTPPPPPPPYLPPPPSSGVGGPVPAAPPLYGGAAPQYPFGGTTMGATPSRSGKAIAALVLGIVGVVLCFGVIVSLLAVIFGLLAAKEIKQSAGSITGLGKARAGWILGAIGLVAGSIFWVVVAREIAGTTAVTDLEVGDCVDLPSGFEDEDEVGRVKTFECTEPHDAEVFSVGDLGDGDDPYPSMRDIEDLMAEACLPDFEDYVGLSYEQSVYEVYRFYPLEETWEDYQGYVCLVVDPDGAELTESVEGSGR